jgi:hypothetical protein
MTKGDGMSIKPLMREPSGFVSLDASLAAVAERCAGDPTACFVVTDAQCVVGVLTPPTCGPPGHRACPGLPRTSTAR